MRENREIGEDAGWKKSNAPVSYYFYSFPSNSLLPCTFLYFGYGFDYNAGPQSQLAHPLTSSAQATDDAPIHDEYALEANMPIINKQVTMV